MFQIKWYHNASLNNNIFQTISSKYSYFAAMNQNQNKIQPKNHPISQTLQTQQSKPKISRYKKKYPEFTIS